jgi:glutathione S-transferase
MVAGRPMHLACTLRLDLIPCAGREGFMLTVHHLNNSRSQRILWLLEELGTPYEIVKYRRMEPIPLAPPELKDVHPLGKSPVITDGGKTIAESGAIVEYIIDKYGSGRLRPKPGTDDYWKYVEWMHYAEGSAMLPLLLALYAGLLGDAAAMLRPRIDGEIANNLSYMETALDGRDFFVGSDLTGADIQLLFVLEAAGDRLQPYPALVAYRDRMHARPAYRRGIEKGGPYQLLSR